MFFTHVKELFGDVVLKPVVRPLRWSNMATMPALPETQESIKEEIRRQVCEAWLLIQDRSTEVTDLSGIFLHLFLCSSRPHFSHRLHVAHNFSDLDLYMFL